MSNKKPIEVQGTTLTERHGSWFLVISSKTELVELEFSRAEWEKLAGSARWFNKHVTVINPKEND
jgi:hypothetical protein